MLWPPPLFIFPFPGLFPGRPINFRARRGLFGVRGSPGRVGGLVKARVFCCSAPEGPDRREEACRRAHGSHGRGAPLQASLCSRARSWRPVPQPVGRVLTACLLARLQEACDGFGSMEHHQCMPSSTGTQQQHKQGPAGSGLAAGGNGLDSLLAGVEEAVGEARRQAQAAQADAAYWRQQ